MSVLSFHLVRSPQIDSLKSIYQLTRLSKRSYSCLILKKELAITRTVNVNFHPVFTVSKRTLRKKISSMGSFGTSHLKPQHARDKISGAYEFVYGSSNTRMYIWFTPMILVCLAGLITVCVKTFYDVRWQKEEKPVYEFSRFKIVLDDENPVKFTYLVFPFSLLMLFSVVRYLSTFLIRMYYNSSTNEFIAVILKFGIFKKKVHFKPSDVTVLEKFSLKGNVIIKGNQVIVAESNFLSTPVYNIFMGYKIDTPSKYQTKIDGENLKKLLEKMGKELEKTEKKNFEDFAKTQQEKRKRNLTKKIIDKN